MKHQVACLSYSPRAIEWLGETRYAQVLHRFPEALNLINARREVCSIVVPAVGNGPFAVVVDVDDLYGLLGGEDEITVEGDQLSVGDTLVSFESAEMWDPIPDWEAVAVVEKVELIKDIEEQLQSDSSGGGMEGVFFPDRGGNGADSRFAASLRDGSSLILDGLAKDDAVKVRAGAAALAGLGVGLTPSGDDFLIGVMFGLWATKPRKKTREICNLIYERAAGRTTTLSTAWLEAARHGEAGEKWHRFVKAASAIHPLEVKKSIREIFGTGETSGADALMGFVQVLKLEHRS